MCSCRTKGGGERRLFVKSRGGGKEGVISGTQNTSMGSVMMGGQEEDGKDCIAGDTNNKHDQSWLIYCVLQMRRGCDVRVLTLPSSQ
jgi:hypothetical protein